MHLLLFAALLGCAACSADGEARAEAEGPGTSVNHPWAFTEVAGAVGIAGPVRSAGQRSFDLDFQDFDGDGDVDLLAADHGGVLAERSRFFRNDAGRFVDVTRAGFGGVDQKGRGNIQDVLSADLSGDGRIDVVTTSNDGIGWAYKGDGPMRFTGYSEFPGWNGWVAGRGVTFGDIDRDGDLDVFIGRHGGPARLLRNDRGRFTDISGTLPTNLFSAIQPYFADFDGDGNVDLLTTVMLVYFNAPWPDGLEARAHLLLGNGNGTFRDATSSSNIGALAYVNCPIAVGDLDNDGDLDLFQIGVPHDPGRRAFDGTTAYPKLLANDGKGVFRDATGSGRFPALFSGNALYWAKGLVEDVDHDGLQDIVIVKSSPLAFRNMGNLAFASKTPPQFRFDGYGAVAAGDYDGDGDLDFAFTEQPSGVRLYRNEQNDGGWLNVRLSGPAWNREAIGATITLYDAGKLGDRAALRGYRQIISSSNHHTPYQQHFGVRAGARYDLRVVWPGGRTTDQRSVSAGRTLTLAP